MILPQIDDPPRYQGLYVFDFGEWCAVGYTASEIESLLESERYRDGKVYRIQRALPDGRMELRGVSSDRFQLESGMFFLRDDISAARRDFEELTAAAEATPPPCRAKLQLAQRGGAVDAPATVTALIFPAEFEEDVGNWLTDVGFAGGDSVEGGISHVTDFQNQNTRILDRCQLWSADRQSRPPHEVLANVRRAVQR